MTQAVRSAHSFAKNANESGTPASGLSRLRQNERPPRQTEFWRLLLLCAGESQRRAASVQRTRLLADGCEVGAGVNTALTELGKQRCTSGLSPKFSRLLLEYRYRA